MARLKGTCSKCGKTASLFFDDNTEEWDEVQTGQITALVGWIKF